MADKPLHRRWVYRARAVGLRIDSTAYVVFAGLSVLLVALLFYGSLRQQLFYSAVRLDPYLSMGDWSAPLDDVFIHFDFARSAARGAPFEWARGNGYSSGGTSLLYPLVLAPGYMLGFRQERLMQFAAVIACTSVFALLLSARRLFRDLPRFAKYLAPPFLLSIGGLDWSLFCGMEVAFFLAVWGLAFVLWDDLCRGQREGIAPNSSASRALPLGVANALLVLTRPEAFVMVAVFATSAAWRAVDRHGKRRGFLVLASSAGLAAVVLVGQAIANRLLTGDFSAAGALVKLELYDPRLSGREVFDAWIHYVRYQVGRVTDHHVGGNLVIGSLLWVLAALPLAFERTRAYALVLWTQALTWVSIVALNGQVRWQNERYSMPALALLLLSAALGTGALLACNFRERTRARTWRLLASISVVGATSTLAFAEAPRMRDQAWFFGRASRNIRDQHIKVARRIRHELPSTRRVLVGDAGAIPYASDLPALDVIGLGGYPGLPFARAGRWGIAASVELIEHIAPEARPDVLAIYPGWWGDFPSWFGEPIGGVSVRGNVVCGGLTKMVYRARWDALDGTERPAFPLREAERSIDGIDFGDVLSEGAHHYGILGAPGHAAMKLLPRPDRPDGGLWDAGRVVPPGAVVDFVLSGFAASRRARLIVRVAPPQPAVLEFEVNRTPVPGAVLRPKDGWAEVSVELAPDRVDRTLSIRLRVLQSEVVLYHLWGVQAE